MENIFGKKTLFLAAGLCLFAGCSPENVLIFDGDRAFSETEALVRISPRNSGTGKARIAAVHLEGRLKDLGLKAVVENFSETTPAGKTVFNNVLARLPGKTNRLIILASHFDTKSGVSPDFQGANDSGSSCGILLELARVLSEQEPLDTEFLFAFFDGEECHTQYGPEDGLHGSRRLAQQIYTGGGGEHVEAMILLDMVGDQDLKVSVPRNSSPELIKELFTAAKQLDVRAKFGLAKGGMTDDHVPFVLAGMPAIDVIDFEYGSAPGLNDYWHTPEDTLDKLSVDSMQIVGDVVLRMVQNMQ